MMLTFTGVLPAHAGMIPHTLSARVALLGAPRTCGDDPSARMASSSAKVCSPHMRG